MNDATTATAIFPFIGMNRSTNPINQDHLPNPLRPAIINTPLKNQPPPTSTPDPPHNPRSAPPERATNRRRPSTRQPPEREPAVRSQARSGPATTPPLHQVPPSPEEEHASDDRRRRAKQPASAGRGKPDRDASDDERGASTDGNSEKRNELPSNVIDTRKPTAISQYPERKTSSQTPDYPQQGNQQRVALLKRVWVG